MASVLEVPCSGLHGADGSQRDDVAYRGRGSVSPACGAGRMKPDWTSNCAIRTGSRPQGLSCQPTVPADRAAGGDTVRDHDQDCRGDPGGEIGRSRPSPIGQAGIVIVFRLSRARVAVRRLGIAQLIVRPERLHPFVHRSAETAIMFIM